MKKIVQELSDYALWKDSFDIIRQRIAEIEDEMVGFGGGGADAPVKKSGNDREKRLCALIDEKTELINTLEKRIKQKEYIEKGLDRLTEEERNVLDIFYMRSLKYGEAMNTALRDLPMCEKTIDRTRQNALRKYSLCEFGK